ncbi:mobile mystery protein B [Erwiniaceae bacterium BAC15a-03b]|uniref:Mobile mystery protein B n=1 Tax=Winslowiella arboricola TaxID=2978220 RepID=A0A9J6PRW1_9GAMM|nr:mobile mystery protein B [Winslowiella arboricola]MCU5773704.1 mobile mystery protein B [Winslowiella arboricola]MCU5778397.1 mobile mystery protein B [Winslowiella arboricola]
MIKGINSNLPDGATALSPDDMVGLIPDYIMTRDDLNEFEKMNIQQAISWLRRQRFHYNKVLSIEFCCKLHQRMFDATWEWAGKFRLREVNIGNTPPYMISTRVRETLDNACYWVENKTYPLDEICLRLHRDIVWIHPFPNGNGRHSRIYCDILRTALGKRSFTWGNSTENLGDADAQRTDYITALREADLGNYQQLLCFARSENKKDAIAL